MTGVKSLRLLAGVWVVTACAATEADARQVTGSVHGTVRAAGAGTAVSGADVTLLVAGADTAVAVTATDDQGRFRFERLGPAQYAVRAAVPGFPPTTSSPFAVDGDAVAIDLELPLTLTDSAVATAKAASTVTAAATDTMSGRMIDIAPVKGDDFASLLPLVPGVLRGPDGRIGMKGGRPAQTGLQLGQAYVNDPTTGEAAFDLPVDAIDSVQVVANPYAAEAGRFSSGQATIETRAGTDQWRVSLNNFIPVPCLRICDGESLGIRAYDPRFAIGGPLVTGRLRLSQSAQFHRQLIRVPSLPDDGNDVSALSFYSFTRLDATLGAHETTGTVAVYPKNVRYSNLSTFVPRAATVELRQRGYSAQIADRWRLSPVTLVESTIALKRYDMAIGAEGTAPMVLAPAGVSGNAFNDQDRQSQTLQWVQSLRTVRRWRGDHAFKTGVDLLQASFEGTSASRPVEIRAADGTLRERVRFLRAATLSQAATDLGLYAQDLWRISDRVLIDAGLRFDHGSLTRGVFSPRVGAILSPRPGSRAILRGGIGVFTERTPLLAGAFAAFEPREVTTYDSNGPTTSLITPRRAALDPARAVVWNLQYDYKFDEHTGMRVNHLRRSGRNQLIVTPEDDALLLASTGRSRYQETEVTLRRALSDSKQASLSYVYSRSEGDLNGFDLLFGNIRTPVIRANAYGRTTVDVPHRLVAFAATEVGRWRVAPLFEVRSGFPYSPVDDAQQFVGRRNTRRFPVFTSLDLTINREIRVRGRRVRIGARANHVLRNRAPRDVQLNTADPRFGIFYNSIVPRVGLTIELPQ
ncbi:MAG: TonB-dependent receptor [Acidobacteria bacterium]|nr:TonB-dependent receptor [Acidobacteriota bacterium]